MVFGNWVAGHAGRLVAASLLGSPLALVVTLLLPRGLLLPYGYVALPALFLVTTVGSVLALGMMMRLIDAAEHAETLGAALSHGSLNIGNALGAWLGGVTIAAGWATARRCWSARCCRCAGFVVLVARPFRADRGAATPPPRETGSRRGVTAGPPPPTHGARACTDDKTRSRSMRTIEASTRPRAFDVLSARPAPPSRARRRPAIVLSLERGDRITQSGQQCAG